MGDADALQRSDWGILFVCQTARNRGMGTKGGLRVDVWTEQMT